MKPIAGTTNDKAIIARMKAMHHTNALPKVDVTVTLTADDEKSVMEKLSALFARLKGISK